MSDPGWRQGLTTKTVPHSVATLHSRVVSRLLIFIKDLNNLTRQQTVRLRAVNEIVALSRRKKAISRVHSVNTKSSGSVIELVRAVFRSWRKRTWLRQQCMFVYLQALQPQTETIVTGASAESDQPDSMQFDTFSHTAEVGSRKSELCISLLIQSCLLTGSFLIGTS